MPEVPGSPLLTAKQAGYLLGRQWITRDTHGAHLLVLFGGGHMYRVLVLLASVHANMSASACKCRCCFDEAAYYDVRTYGVRVTHSGLTIMSLFN